MIGCQAQAQSPTGMMWALQEQTQVQARDSEKNSARQECGVGIFSDASSHHRGGVIAQPLQTVHETRWASSSARMHNSAPGPRRSN